MREGYEEEEEQTSGGGNIKNCEKVNNKDNTICDSCEDNYDWDSKTKSCVFLCEGETEQYCEECDLNYNSYDYGKTCEKIDPDYVEKGFSKYAKFDFAVLCILLFLVLWNIRDWIIKKYFNSLLQEKFEIINYFYY